MRGVETVIRVEMASCRSEGAVAIIQALASGVNVETKNFPVTYLRGQGKIFYFRNDKGTVPEGIKIYVSGEIRMGLTSVNQRLGLQGHS